MEALAGDRKNQALRFTLLCHRVSVIAKASGIAGDREGRRGEKEAIDSSTAIGVER